LIPQNESFYHRLLYSSLKLNLKNFNRLYNARGGSGVVSRSALLKGGDGTRRGVLRKQLARCSRRSSSMRSIKAQE